MLTGGGQTARRAPAAVQDIHARACDLLLNLPTVQAWPAMQALVRRAAAQKDRHWGLPVLACEAVGGDAEQAMPAVAAIACLQISIILIDDLLDADPRGEHHRVGAPAAANLAAAFQAMGLESVACSEAEPAAKQTLMRRLNAMALTTALGQQWDSQNAVDETGYWRVVETKSAPFFGAALAAGALLGGAPAETVAQLERLGRLYGEMIQIHDDLRDSLAVPANPDWTQGRAALPILFAQVVDHPERERFLALRRMITDPQALAEAQGILIRSGAISYGVHEVARRHAAARRLVGALSLRRSDGLESLLEDLMRPVRGLFEAAGARPA